MMFEAVACIAYQVVVMVSVTCYSVPCTDQLMLNWPGRYRGTGGLFDGGLVSLGRLILVQKRDGLERRR